MVTSPHEALHRIFQRDTSLFTRAFTHLGITFPTPKAVSVLNVDLTEIAPLERRVDTALMVDTDNGGHHVIIIESQTARDPSRRFSWPYYVAYLNNRYACPVTLLVVTADSLTADWARQPIHVGLPEAPTQTTRPLVLGPADVPRVTTVDQAAQDVMVAVLSALTHRHTADANEILEALAAALASVDLGTAAYLAEFTEVGLGDGQAAEFWRALMRATKFGFESQLHREWREEGRVQEAAAAVLRVLKARGMAVSADVAQRIRECTDLDLLQDLLIRAVRVNYADELFIG